MGSLMRRFVVRAGQEKELVRLLIGLNRLTGTNHLTSVLGEFVTLRRSLRGLVNGGSAK